MKDFNKYYHMRSVVLGCCAAFKPCAGHNTPDSSPTSSRSILITGGDVSYALLPPALQALLALSV